MKLENPKTRSDLTLKKTGNEGVIYGHEGSEQIHVLNSTAMFIWEHLDGAHSMAEIESELRRRFAVAAGMEITADIERTITRFESLGLLQD